MSSERIIEANNEENFLELLKSFSKDEIVVVYFYVSWGDSSKIESELEALIESQEDVLLIKIDSEKQPELMKKYDVQATPVFHIFMNGEKKTEIGILGADYSELESKIEELTLSKAMKMSSSIHEEEKEEKKEEKKEESQKGWVEGEEALAVLEQEFGKDKVTVLMEMGYSRLVSIKGLMMSGSSKVENAVSWITDHITDKDIDEPIKMRIENEEEKKKRIQKKQKEFKEEMKLRRELREQQEIKKSARSEIQRRERERQVREANENYKRAQRKREIEEMKREKREQKREMKKMRRLLKLDKAKRKIKSLREKGKIEEAEKLEIKFGLREKRTEAKVENKKTEEKKKEEEVVPRKQTVRISIRTLSGGRQTKEFNPTEKLRTVYNWAASFNSGRNFNLSMSFPRKVFTSSEMSKALKDVGLERGGMLICAP